MSSHERIDEARRRRFESAWTNGQRPRIKDFLPEISDPRYSWTLEELVAIDLEFRWREDVSRQGDAGPRLEQYLAEFPLVRRADMLERLVEAEIDARLQGGGHPTAAEYGRRFPSLANHEQLAAKLARARFALRNRPGDCGGTAVRSWPHAVPPGCDWGLRIHGSPIVCRAPRNKDRCSVGRQRRRRGEPASRGSDLVIRVPGSEQASLYISRRHFEVHQRADGLHIVDCSTAGTVLNTRRLVKGQLTPIQFGDRIQVGGVLTLELLVQHCGADAGSESKQGARLAQ